MAVQIQCSFINFFSCRFNHLFRLRDRFKVQGSRFRVCNSATKLNSFQKTRLSVNITNALKRALRTARLIPYTLYLIPVIFYLIPATLPAAYAAQVALEWDANSEPELAGYKIHWGTTSGNYTSSKDVGKTTTCTLTGLDEGKTYYFAATAYDGNSNESDYSNQISYTVPYSDTDGDGVPDYEDAFPTNPAETVDTDGDGTGNNADTDDDGDGMPDTWENKYGFNPLVDDASGDEDGDGLSNLDEYRAGTNPVASQDNLEPDAPGLAAPANNQVVEMTPQLKTDAFFDPNSGDFHSATQWRIHRQSDNICVFDITSEYSLTQIDVPKLILDDNEAYSWQARHYDNHGTPSPWSASGSFSTPVDPNDTNSNGIPDEQEVTTPTDLDGDGTWDSDQNTIKCVVTGENKSLGISFKGSSTVVGIESVSAEHENGTNTYASAVSTPDYFPFGLINFKLIMDRPGDQAEITIYFSEPAPQDGRWFKYDPIETTWTDYSSQTEFSPDRYALTLYLEDGGDGDADGIANGIIVDPSGVGVSAASSGSSVGGEITGEGVTCFISAVSSPARENQPSSVWELIYGRELVFGLLLLALLKGISVVTRRARKRWDEYQRRYEMYHQHGKRFTARNL